MKDQADRINRAKTALAHRLRAFNVDESTSRAAEFIDALVAEGWRWAPNDRPQPPKPDEACTICGRHADRCICDTDGTPTTRPAVADRVPPTSTYQQARRVMRQGEETT